MFRGSVLGVLIDKATSHLLLESDWVTIMHICDLISQNDVEPRTVFVLIKEKLKSENPCTALYALIVLEGIIKNCGFTVCKELTTKMNCQFLYELARTTPHSKVKEKLLELIQACAFALRKNSQHGHLKRDRADLVLWIVRKLMFFQNFSSVLSAEATRVLGRTIWGSQHKIKLISAKTPKSTLACNKIAYTSKNK
ncbi:unnamed protein product [Brassicogethes aeneus]|uniref:VHS domain-containing protein n=1 Tax=Brassicogethes aeneus TaxID=1431903 RepID=A0A9P0FBK7_BRAAE|nr:unnamed protein product [Brassicogethes aeneus]